MSDTKSNSKFPTGTLATNRVVVKVLLIDRNGCFDHPVASSNQAHGNGCFQGTGAAISGRALRKRLLPLRGNTLGVRQKLKGPFMGPFFVFYAIPCAVECPLSASSRHEQRPGVRRYEQYQFVDLELYARLPQILILY